MSSQPVIRWLWGIAVAFLLAGIVLGRGSYRLEASQRPNSGLEPADVQFVEAVVGRYELNPNQQRKLEVVVLERQRARDRVLRKYFERIPEVVKQEVQEAAELADLRIRALLDPEQRRRYTEDLAATNK